MNDYTFQLDFFESYHKIHVFVACFVHGTERSVNKYRIKAEYHGKTSYSGEVESEMEGYRYDSVFVPRAKSLFNYHALRRIFSFPIKISGDMNLEHIDGQDGGGRTEPGSNYAIQAL